MTSHTRVSSHETLDSHASPKWKKLKESQTRLIRLFIWHFLLKFFGSSKVWSIIRVSEGELRIKLTLSLTLTLNLLFTEKMCFYHHIMIFTALSFLRLRYNEEEMSVTIYFMSWYCKRQPTWRKGLITYNSHLWSEFSFNWYFGEGGRRGFRLRLDVQGKGVGRILHIGKRDKENKGAGGTWKPDNFHGRCMCIVP